MQRDGDRMCTDFTAAAFNTIAMIHRKHRRAQIKLRLVDVIHPLYRAL